MRDGAGALKRNFSGSPGKKKYKFLNPFVHLFVDSFSRERGIPDSIEIQRKPPWYPIDTLFSVDGFHPADDRNRLISFARVIRSPTVRARK